MAVDVNSVESEDVVMSRYVPEHKYKYWAGSPRYGITVETRYIWLIDIGPVLCVWRKGVLKQGPMFTSF